MKRFLVVTFVIIIGITLSASVCATLAAEKDPVSKLANTTVDATKRVGSVATGSVQVVSDAAVGTTKAVTGQAGNPVNAVAGTTVSATKGVGGVATDSVEAVSDTAQETTASIF